MCVRNYHGTNLVLFLHIFTITISVGIPTEPMKNVFLVVYYYANFISILLFLKLWYNEDGYLELFSLAPVILLQKVSNLHLNEFSCPSSLEQILSRTPDIIDGFVYIRSALNLHTILPSC